ncbi:uncharacterized protein LOC132748225 [Ruditapes philippinarum]|uniref:uncharacterized protein LOC132748225 n=1 Tax=Ruditapes philippinarum TaxID=129788 RepID=UPI00295A60AC|nr:uncharacterized protein LOC132748225 [Ruditapes philippinarum]XP_060593773.1 uncharacterized protein LOC132748225 [Ruditapes philippinarum]
MGTNDTVIALTSESGHNVAMTTHSSDITSSYVTSSSLHTFHLNSTDLHANASETEVHPGIVSGIDGLGTSVTIAVALSSVAFVVVIVIIMVCFVRKKYREKKSRAWVDNLTLSYIADSNIDLTKDNYDEMISLDNDNFLNSLVDSQSFSVYSSSNNNNTRQYTYSYF